MNLIQNKKYMSNIVKDFFQPRQKENLSTPAFNIHFLIAVFNFYLKSQIDQAITRI